MPLYINDTDLADIGFEVATDRGGAVDWWQGPTRDYVGAEVLARWGLYISGEPRGQARTLSIPGVTLGTSVANKASNERALEALLSAGAVRITVDDGVNSPRCIDALVTKLAKENFGPLLTAHTSRTTGAGLEFLCPDPTWRDVSGTVASFGTTRTAIPLGTASASHVLIRLFGSATNQVVTYRTAGGQAVQTCGLTFSPGANDYVEIDCHRSTITKVVSGTRTVDNSLLTSGSFPILDPQDGDVVNGIYPTLETSAGTGEVLYVKRWLSPS